MYFIELHYLTINKHLNFFLTFFHIFNFSTLQLDLKKNVTELTQLVLTLFVIGSSIMYFGRYLKGVKYFLFILLDKNLKRNVLPKMKQKRRK